MDKEFNITARWRNKRLHRKCLFCSYVKMLPSTRCSPDTWICQCKDKVVNPDTIRPFCKCFKVNIKECENIDKILYGGIPPSVAKKTAEKTNLN